jgi:hypothetical protein
MNEKFFEFFKDPGGYIKRLLQDSLDEKWFEDSRANLFLPCPFCEDTNVRTYETGDMADTCSFCLCPPEICQDGGFGGMIGALIVSHPKTEGRTRLADLGEKELHGMLTLFKARLDDMDCRD